jgi:hypothetical protein
MAIILVSLKTDDPEKGSAKICCDSIKVDPLLPQTHLLLEGIKGLSWPFSGAWIDVQKWSVPRDTILNWMVGPLRDQPSLTVAKLKEEGQDVPHPPGTLPSQDLDNDKVEITQLLENEKIQEGRAEQARKAMQQKASSKKGSGS